MASRKAGWSCGLAVAAVAVAAAWATLPARAQEPPREEGAQRQVTVDMARWVLREARAAGVPVQVGAPDVSTTAPLVIDGRRLPNDAFQMAQAEFMRNQKIDDTRSTESLALFRTSFALRDLTAARARAEGVDAHEEFRRQAEQMYNSLLTEYYLKTVVVADVSVAATEVEQYYESHPDEFNEPPMATFQIIVTKSREDADKAVAQLGQEIAFESVANELSIHASRRNGGVLKPLARGQLDPKVEEVAWELETNEVSEPIETDGHFYIVKLTAMTPSRVIPLETARPRIFEKLYDSKRRTMLGDFARGLLDGHQVVLFDANGTTGSLAITAPAVAAAP